jgi:hypothetical protein
MKGLMKTWVAILTVVAFLVATFPASAAEAAPAPAKAPLFITKGRPMTSQDITSLHQEMMLNGRISHDAGGSSDDDQDTITKADEVFVGVIVIAAIAGLVYLTVLEAENTSKLF